MKRRLLVSGLAVLVMITTFGLGVVVRPSLDSFIVGQERSLHEYRKNVGDWKYGPLQVVSAQWKLTGERNRTDGRDDLIWLWRIVLLNASDLALRSRECRVRVVKFSLRDPQGFEVAATEPVPEKITVEGRATASVSGSGRLPGARMSPQLQPSWELEVTCPDRLPDFGEAKITEILEIAPQDLRHPLVWWLFANRDSRTLGSVAKARALHSFRASYIREANAREHPMGRVPPGFDPDVWKALVLGPPPAAIQIQFSKGAQLRVGDSIYTFAERDVADEAGVRSVGYGFTINGASLPLRWWRDETGRNR